MIQHHSAEDRALKAGLTHQGYHLGHYVSALRSAGFVLERWRHTRRPINAARYPLLHRVDRALVRVFGLQEWNGTGWLKYLRATMLGGRVSLFARRSKPSLVEPADRAIVPIRAGRLMAAADTIERCQGEQRQLLELLQRASQEDSPEPAD